MPIHSPLQHLTRFLFLLFFPKKRNEEKEIKTKCTTTPITDDKQIIGEIKEICGA